MWLEGPLQSWGYDSKFGRRDTLDFPTKSGVLGLLCCALGKGGEQKGWLSYWAECELIIEAYALLDPAEQRALRQPLLRDFHMVGSGYDDKDPWQSLLIPKKSDGKKAVGGGTKLTYRYYLQDMAFAAILKGARTELEELQHALCNPVWDIYLGRKNCPPTEFIGRGVYADLNEALEEARNLASSVNRTLKKAPVFKVLEGEHEEGELLTLNDVPIQFGQNKQYRDRQVTVIPYG